MCRADRTKSIGHRPEDDEWEKIQADIITSREQKKKKKKKNVSHSQHDDTTEPWTKYHSISLDGEKPLRAQVRYSVIIITTINDNNNK